MNVYRLRCDGCNREADVPVAGMRWAPNGWFIVEGSYGCGEPYDQYHACSPECLVMFGNRERIRLAEAERKALVKL